MLAEKNVGSSVPVPNSTQLALAVIMERIQSLPKEDKDDLFELSKVWFTAEDDEERNSARFAMQEILDQQRSGFVPLAMIETPGDDLKKWVEYVGAKIKEKRKVAGLSQQELERKSGLPQSHISRLENGQHSPSFATLEKIAQALGIPVTELEPCIEQ
jgi:DNA-binding XRE family transcriptional regulator